MEEIVNRVAKSGLITLDLEDYYLEGERVFFDIKDFLWQEIALKEKDFREMVKAHDWENYQDKYVAIDCSVDAIVPTWAYMLIATQLTPYVKRLVFGSVDYLNAVLYESAIRENVIAEEYQDARIVIKGCSKKAVPTSAYLRLTELLQPYAKAIMYGEPCSTVPLYKKPRV